jgi:hypothetical protein
MKRLLLVFIIAVCTSCSFDNKTGIWKDASNISIDKQVTKIILENKNNTKYENIFIKNKVYDEEKKAVNPSIIKISGPVKISNWHEQYAISTNNISNFSYSNNKVLISKSRKLSRISPTKNKSNKKIIFYKNNLISHDHKGTIFIYSLSLKKKNI